MDTTRTYSILANVHPRPRLVLTAVLPHGLEQWTLPTKGRVSIGTAASNDIVLAYASVAPHHAILELGDVLCVRAVGTSATRVDGIGLSEHESAEMPVGSSMELGNVLLTLQSHGHAAAGSSTTAHAPGSDDNALVSPADRPEVGGNMRFTRANGRVVEVSATMAQILERLRRVASSSITLLVTGETGVGKELVAEFVHRTSSRYRGPFVPIHCASLSANLIESELFGHERGAFTGATQHKLGLLESADGGTVFLDEIGEIDASVQVKLLRVLEDRSILRVGSNSPRQVDIRFVAATHRDLRAEVHAGRFREDLYYRLTGYTVYIPPLRERGDEILKLADAFLQTFLPHGTLTDDARQMLLEHDFPGNIRELRMAMERAAALANSPCIGPENFDFGARTSATTPLRKPRDHQPDTLHEVANALKECAGNQTAAARKLGISRRTFVTRLQQLRASTSPHGQ
jgi:two-component system, NtrC family, response regulator AtoC